jgi:hypothetical protein
MQDVKERITLGRRDGKLDDFTDKIGHHQNPAPVTRAHNNGYWYFLEFSLCPLGLGDQSRPEPIDWLQLRTPESDIKAPTTQP